MYSWEASLSNQRNSIRSASRIFARSIIIPLLRQQPPLLSKMLQGISIFRQSQYNSLKEFTENIRKENQS